MVIYQPETVKGFQDFLPPDSLKREAVRKVIKKNFKLYGFEPLETPTVEFEELMRPDSTQDEDEAVSDRFRLKDKGLRNLALRYEFTFQLSKILKLNPNLKLPFRRYQIGNVFRDEPISSERFREFTQCDADIIGDVTLNSDAECLSLVTEIMSELKIKSEILVNNRKLLDAIIESVQIRNKKEVLRELDKIDKIGEDIVKANIRKHADANQVLTLFKLLEKPLEFFEKNLFDGAADLIELEKKSKLYGFKFKFAPSLVRGLSYYTGNIFEVKVEGKKETIAAGGRYDKTVGKFALREIPAVGISFGLERLTSLAKVDIESTKAILTSINRPKETIKLAQVMRKSGVSCMAFFNEVGKSLEYANSKAIPYVIFIGDDEIKKGKFKLRNMKSGDESMLSEKQIVNKLKKA